MSGQIVVILSDEAAAMLALSSGLAPFEDLLDPEATGLARVLSRARLEWETLPCGSVHVWWSLLDPGAWQRVQQRIEFLASHGASMFGVLQISKDGPQAGALEVLQAWDNHGFSGWSLTVADGAVVYGALGLLSDDQQRVLCEERPSLVQRVRNDLDFFQVFARS